MNIQVYKSAVFDSKMILLWKKQTLKNLTNLFFNLLSLFGPVLSEM